MFCCVCKSHRKCDLKFQLFFVSLLISIQFLNVYSHKFTEKITKLQLKVAFARCRQSNVSWNSIKCIGSVGRVWFRVGSYSKKSILRFYIDCRLSNSFESTYDCQINFNFEFKQSKKQFEIRRSVKLTVDCRMDDILNNYGYFRTRGVCIWPLLFKTRDNFEWINFRLSKNH